MLHGAWAAYCAGSLPVAAAVVAADGTLVARARNRRHEQAAPRGQLANTRIAHAEVNALAQLPTDADYSSLALYSNVEPCCLCMGAALQTGLGQVHYAWADAYAGAAAMTVPNLQVQRRPVVVRGPGPPEASLVTAALLACHYVLVRPDHLDVAEVWVRGDPQFLLRVRTTGLAELVAQAAAAGAPAADVLPTLTERLLARS